MAALTGSIADSAGRGISRPHVVGDAGKRRLLMLTRYGRLGASSRQRCLLFKEPLQHRGIVIGENQLLSDAYLRRLYANRPLHRIEIVRGYLRRFLALLRCDPSDVVWVEKEALPWMPAAIERLLIGRRFLIVDFDDGWHLKYNAPDARWHARLVARKLDVLARTADLVLVANRELLSWAHASGARNVVHIPTVVDVDRYPVVDEPDGPFTIGWIGTPANLRYLQTIVRPLRQLSAEGARLLVIGAPSGFALPGVELEAVPWSEATEAEQLGRCHVGIMPLDDTPWDRFKSGYKLIQYMAAGRATVASPVGANLEIVAHGRTGFLAQTDDEWATALARLRDDAELRGRFGAEGRHRCAGYYSLSSVLERLLEALLPCWCDDAAPDPVTTHGGAV
jgi:glycosyltransferase involved in cell wall biosynthesis